MTDDDNDLSDMLSGSEDSDAAQKPLGLFCRAVCLNSVELELLAMSFQEAALASDVEFIEVEDGEIEATSAAPPERTPIDDVRSALSAYWQARVALARSISGCTWEK